MVADPKRPASRPGPKTNDGAAVKRQVQPRLTADDKLFSKKRKHGPAANQDWRKG
jgi:hypothetical protein